MNFLRDISANVLANLVASAGCWIAYFIFRRLIDAYFLALIAKISGKSFDQFSAQRKAFVVGLPFRFRFAFILRWIARRKWLLYWRRGRARAAICRWEQAQDEIRARWKEEGVSPDELPLAAKFVSPPSRTRVIPFMGLGWLNAFVLVASATYLLTSAGQAERYKLAVIEEKILRAKADIRNNEIEYAARASFPQLESWRRRVGLESWAPEQVCVNFICGNRALAEALDPAAAAPGKKSIANTGKGTRSKNSRKLPGGS